MVIRSPKADEAQRVSYLFRHCAFPADSHILLAIKSKPVERMVAGIAGWTEGHYGRFHLVTLPGVSLEDAAGELVDRAVETAGAAGLERLLCAKLLTDADPQSAFLSAHRFEILRSERFFRVAACDAIQRVTALLSKYAAQMPGEWRTEGIRGHSPEEILDLIAPFRLLPPEEIKSKWDGTGSEALDPDFSVILFERQKPLGVLLARRSGDWLCYDVRAVQHPDPRMRALANLRLFEAQLKNYNCANPVRWLEFRAGEEEHRETASLAFRMGGKELPPRHVWTRNLQG